MATESERILPGLSLLLPIGISFFTFQAISYTVDIYRGQAEEADSFLQLAAYVAMFPQLIAGPIIRSAFIEKQLRSRTHSYTKFVLGLHFFAIGLTKKVLLADTFALAVPLAFETGPHSVAGAWLGSLGYFLQIYFNVSAYSDMAVGLGFNSRSISIHSTRRLPSPNSGDAGTSLCPRGSAITSTSHWEAINAARPAPSSI